MAKQVRTTLSNSTVKKSRRIEIVCIILVVILIIVGTLLNIFLKWSVLKLSEKCSSKFPELSVNISDGEDYGIRGYKSKAGTIFPLGSFWSRNGSIFGCPCTIKPCIRKCCPENQKYNANVTCVDSNSTSFLPLNLPVFFELSVTQSVKDLKEKKVENDHFLFLYKDVCEKEKFLREPEVYEDDKTFLMEDGRILTIGNTYLNQSQYCLESFVGSDTIYTIECFEKDVEEELKSQEKEAWVYLVRAFGMVVSIPFFLLTFVVYASLTQLQNLHGKALMCHVVCLAVGYTALAVVQIGKAEISQNICITLAFVIQFNFLASFFWLNVMCFDIWWVFSGLMQLRGSLKAAENKKFLIYSCYAWGCPLLVFVTSIILDFAQWVPTSFIKPQFGVNKCWFKDDDATILYFYLPIGMLVSLNVMMYTATACRLHSHTTDSKVLRTGDSQRHYNFERQRFYLYLKLFIVMGVTWVMEVISFMGGGSQIYWLATDLCNTLNGLLVFVIFVCNRRTLRLLNQEYGLGLKIFRANNSTKFNSNSSRTSSSQFSRSSSSTNVTRFLSQNPECFVSMVKV